MISYVELRSSWTVHSPLFFRKIVEIERFALRAAIWHECQNYLGGDGGLGGSEKNIFYFYFFPYFSRPPPPTALILDARPLGTFVSQDGRH